LSIDDERDPLVRCEIDECKDDDVRKLLSKDGSKREADFVSEENDNDGLYPAWLDNDDGRRKAAWLDNDDGGRKALGVSVHANIVDLDKPWLNDDDVGREINEEWLVAERWLDANTCWLDAETCCLDAIANFEFLIVQIYWTYFFLPVTLLEWVFYDKKNVNF